MQAFLGFIGMISMLVAALSIANTMMMSIYERTREIGVMKVLGCKLGNIRMMFLSEAAYIGVFGGILGLIVSYTLSYALNNVAWLQGIVASVMSGSNFFGSGMSIYRSSPRSWPCLPGWALWWFRWPRAFIRPSAPCSFPRWPRSATTIKKSGASRRLGSPGAGAAFFL